MSRAYVDANVLVYAFHPKANTKRDASRALLREHIGTHGASTSALAIDEVVWVLSKDIGRDAAVGIGRAVLGTPGLAFEDVGFVEADHALGLCQEHGLDPRDAIHAAVALGSRCTTILSDDPDFDKVPGLRRVAP